MSVATTVTRVSRFPFGLTLPTLIALLIVYFVWGSTYLAIVYAIETLPPLLMSGARFLVAGSLIYGYAWLNGAKHPSRRALGYAALTGTLMLCFGMGGVAIAETGMVSSGVAATLVGIMPIWSILFSLFLGERPTRLQLLGIIFGVSGVILLNFDTHIQATTLGVGIVVLSSASWALGSVIKRNIKVRYDTINIGAEMLSGGVALTLAGLLRGETYAVTPTLSSVLGWAYLVVFGSLIAFSAYSYLLRHVKISIATSYAFVNPVIAVILGALIGGEVFGLQATIALMMIICAVMLILYGNQTR